MSKLLTPQQELFLSYYTNPKSETFSNALQSAIKAGYSREYAESITVKDLRWLTENIADYKLLEKAEKVLNKTLDLEPLNNEGKVDNALLKTQADVAKFVAETVGKTKYSKRTELTGQNGSSIVFAVAETIANKNAINTQTESNSSE